MESFIVSPGVEADGVGWNGRTSCAFAGGASIPPIASKLQVAREMPILGRHVELRLFVLPLPLSASLMCVSPKSLTGASLFAKCRQTKLCRVQSRRYYHQGGRRGIVRSNSVYRSECAVSSLQMKFLGRLCDSASSWPY